MSRLSVCASKFSWKGKNGFSELSDLRFKGFPESFYIKSPITGVSHLFLANPDGVQYSPCGDIQYVKYFVPGGNFTATIFND